MQDKQRDYLRWLEERVMVFDGAMGTSLEAMELSAVDYGGAHLMGCNDHLNLTYPKAPAVVHSSFLEAGVDVIETNSFRANRITLAEFGLEDKTAEINQRGAEIAKKTADRFSTKKHPRFVAGSMGPTGKLLSLDVTDGDSGLISFEEIRDVYREQAAALISGGVDLLLIETAQDLLEVKAAIVGIRDAFGEKKNTIAYPSAGDIG